MKLLIILLGFTLAINSTALAQGKVCIFPEYKVENGVDLNSIKPTREYKNIHVAPLAHDSLSSSFLIWVKESVALHKHEFHTENVYVLKGSGKMTVGDKTFQLSPGSYVFIPANTPHSLVVDKSMGVMKVLSVQSPNFDGSDRVMIEAPSSSPQGGGQ